LIENRTRDASPVHLLLKSLECPMSDRFELFLTCPKGLEGLLIEEAVGLGLEEAREHTSAVRGMADMETAYRLCLWSRLANRVLLVLKRFPMKDAEDLYHGVLDIEW